MELFDFLDAVTHTWAILGLLVKRFCQQWPDVKIIVRVDTGLLRIVSPDVTA